MVRTLCTSLAMQLIEGKLESELLRITKLRAPNEATGLLFADGRVVELPNHSASPHNSFEMHREDIIAQLDDEMMYLGVTLWHSHPGGGVGPSSIDMRQKQKYTFFQYLVVSLVDGELVSTWY